MNFEKVIQSDFVRLEAETSATEAQDSAAHKTFLNDSEVDKAVKQTQSEHLQRKSVQLKSDLNSAKRDLSTTKEELGAAMSYFDKLKPSCIDAGTTYEDRVARREEEIQSLQEAMKILAGEDIA